MPVAMPRTSPVGVPVSSTFCKAVKCATARPARMDSETFPVANFCATKKRLSAALLSASSAR